MVFKIFPFKLSSVHEFFLSNFPSALFFLNFHSLFWHKVFPLSLSLFTIVFNMLVDDVDSVEDEGSDTHNLVRRGN
jgi:hypothetical protein